MKKILLFATLCFALLAGCGEVTEDPEQPDGPGTVTMETEGGDGITCTAPAGILCCIVDGAEDGCLLLADATEETLYQGKGVYRVNVDEHTLIYVDGELADSSVLEDGMVVEVCYTGAVMETFPAQFGGLQYLVAYPQGSAMNPGGTYYDLCGLYLKVLDDLWQEDPALNEDIAMAGLDLSEVPGGLTEGEKLALAWRFGELHGVEVVGGTLEEIKEAGYLAPYGENTEAYWWEDGCLFAIAANEWEEGEHYSLAVIKFDAYKWRSPLGAYGFSDCSAVWPQMGTWSEYQISAQFIS